MWIFIVKVDLNSKIGKKVVNMRWGFWFDIEVYFENSERIGFFMNIGGIFRDFRDIKY